MIAIEFALPSPAAASTFSREAVVKSGIERSRSYERLTSGLQMDP